MVSIYFAHIVSIGGAIVLVFLGVFDKFISMVSRYRILSEKYSSMFYTIY